VGVVLAVTGFVSRESGKVAAQPSSATFGILLTFSLLPAVVMLFSLLVFRRYDLSVERLAEVVEAAGTGTGITSPTGAHLPREGKS
jgi:Na+/melibiose symporter-like transporter